MEATWDLTSDWPRACTLICHSPCVTLGKPLNVSEPQFPLLQVCCSIVYNQINILSILAPGLELIWIKYSRCYAFYLCY